MKRLLPLALAATLCLPAVPAFAGFGTGIGISFPAGTSHTETADVPSYGAFSADGLVEELTVTEKRGALRIELKVTNTTDAPYSIAHNDGKNYDMAILDKNGNALWRASDGVAYTQALQSQTIAPHRSEVYTVTIERRDYKKIKEDAILVSAGLDDTPYQVMTRVPASVTTTSTTPAIIHGGILIGNGHWDDD